MRFKELNGYISITELIKKYPVVSRKTLVKRINSNEIIGFIGPHSTYFVDEDSFLKYIKLDKDFYTDALKKIDLIKTEFSISSKAILDYSKKGLVKVYKIFDKFYVDRNDILNVIDTINKNKQKRNRSDVERKSDFKIELANVLGPEYIQIDEFSGLKTKIKFKHLACGHEFLAAPESILYSNGQRKKGTRCPFCFGTRKYTQEEAEYLVSSATNGYYQLVGEYKNNKSLVEVKHLSNNCKGHGKIFLTRVNSILDKNGGSCPYCQMSQGEEIIFLFLEKNNLKYQYQVSKVINNKNYRYDFYIPSLNMFIEFDGEQHFSDNPFPGTFSSTIKRDNIKNQYINENNLYLTRIAYTRIKDISTILEDILIKNKTFRDYPLGEYEKVLGKSVVLSNNILYIG